MAEIIKMPRLSDTMEEGVIVEWHKKVGDKVSFGDILAEVETDKATMELENYHEGVLLHIAVEEGAVPVDSVIAVVGEEGEDFKAQLAEAEKESTADTSKDTDGKQSGDVQEKADKPEEKQTEDKQAKQEVSSQSAAQESSTTTDGRVKASPLARSMADDNNINISQVKGTGDGGRIIKRDIEAFIEKGGAQATQPAPIGLDQDVQYGEIPVSQMRKVIAKRLAESKYSAPHFYLTIDINMNKSVEAREQLKKAEVKASYNDIVIKACAAALRKHPMVNSSWLGDKIRVNKEINIGVAVAVQDGLLVPVVRHADQKTLTYINQEVRELATLARDKKLQPDQMTGNTFTISNLGSYGIEEFTAIINPPDACILAVGAIVEKPIVVNGKIEVAHMMKVTLSCDHRVVDGATGAEFLQDVKANLENPLMMLA